MTGAKRLSVPPRRPESTLNRDRASQLEAEIASFPSAAFCLDFGTSDEPSSPQPTHAARVITRACPSCRATGSTHPIPAYDHLRLAACLRHEIYSIDEGGTRLISVLAEGGHQRRTPAVRFLRVLDRELAKLNGYARNQLAQVDMRLAVIAAPASSLAWRRPLPTYSIPPPLAVPAW